METSQFTKCIHVCLCAHSLGACYCGHPGPSCQYQLLEWTRGVASSSVWPSAAYQLAFQGSGGLNQFSAKQGLPDKGVGMELGVTRAFYPRMIGSSVPNWAGRGGVVMRQACHFFSARVSAISAVRLG